MSHDSTSGSRKFSVADLLEKGDGLAHILVSILLLVLAVGVLVNSTWGFILHISNHNEKFDFPQEALNYLSDILFGVIILELLSTILTYIHARNLAATIKDFIVVGLISSVRKILLVGAQSSLASHKGTVEGAGGAAAEFVSESIGTVITIVGILMLIGGLIWLEKSRHVTEPKEHIGDE